MTVVKAPIFRLLQDSFGFTSVVVVLCCQRFVQICIFGQSGDVFLVDQYYLLSVLSGDAPVEQNRSEQ